MTIGLKKIIKQADCNDYSKCGMSEPPQVIIEGEAYLASFLILELDIGVPSYFYIYGKKG
jgi:hypothetical protein